MRTETSAEDSAAAAAVVTRLWEAWEDRCAKADTEPRFADLAKAARVEPETLRVMVRRAQDGRLRSGPTFTAVAKLARETGVSLRELGTIATRSDR